MTQYVELGSVCLLADSGCHSPASRGVETEKRERGELHREGAKGAKRGGLGGADAAGTGTTDQPRNTRNARKGG